jgi:hypothetical protein
MDDSEIKFDGVISPEVAFQVGRFTTMAMFLNDRATSSWVEFTPIEIGFTLHQEEETNLFRVTMILNKSLRSVQRQLDGFTTEEDARLFIDALEKFIKDNVI